MAAFVVWNILSDEEDDPAVVPRLFKDLQHPFAGLSDMQIYNRYRFPPHIILEIVDLLKLDIEYPSKRSRALPPLYQVCIGLRYLASNSFQQVIGDTIGVSKSTVCRSFWRFANALVRHLNAYVKFPTVAERAVIIDNFYSIAQFPNVFGLIDGTHVRIVPPSTTQGAFVNRKSFHSINVQAICNAAGAFINIVARCAGSVHDSRMFRESIVYRALENEPFNGYLLGDSGYACRSFLLTPYLIADSPAKVRYNRSHSKTRVLIEQVFGRWKRRFSCLHSELRLIPDKCCLVIVCCAILHNIAVSNALPEFDDDDLSIENNNVNVYDGPIPNDGNQCRNLILQRFFTR